MKISIRLYSFSQKTDIEEIQISVTYVNYDCVGIELGNVKEGDKFNKSTVGISIFNGWSLKTHHASSEPRLNSVRVDGVTVPGEGGGQSSR